MAKAKVMLRHFGARGGALDPDASITRLILWGSQGVALFFVLSGFLIGGQILEEVSSGGFSFKRFYFKRILRIFPPYYFSLFVVSVLFFAGIADDNIVCGRTFGRGIRDGGQAWAVQAACRA